MTFERLMDQAAFQAWQVDESEDEYFALQHGDYDTWNEKEGRFDPFPDYDDD